MALCIDSSFFTASPIPMWVYDTETLMFLFVNKAAVKKYKYTPEEFRQLNIFEIRPQEEKEKLYTRLSILRQSEIITGQYYKHQDKDGKTFHVQITSFPETYEGRNVRVVQALDLEFYFREHERNSLLVKRLKKQILFLKNITWMQSHSLRSKVTNVLNLLNLHEQEIISTKSFPESLQMMQQEIRQIDETIIKIVSKLNDFTKVEEPANFQEKTKELQQ